MTLEEKPTERIKQVIVSSFVILDAGSRRYKSCLCRREFLDEISLFSTQHAIDRVKQVFQTNSRFVSIVVGYWVARSLANKSAIFPAEFTCLLVLLVIV